VIVRVRSIVFLALVLLSLTPVNSEAKVKSGSAKTVSVLVPAFSVPVSGSTSIVLNAPPLAVPVGTAIDMFKYSKYTTPSDGSVSNLRYAVTGKYCFLSNNLLSAQQPTVCTVYGSVSGGLFTPGAISSSARFSFGLQQSPLIASYSMTDTNLPKGSSVLLATVGGSGSGLVHYSVLPGSSCSDNGVGPSSTNTPICSIFSERVGAVCSVVGNVLTATSPTTCTVNSWKDGDSSYLPVTAIPLNVVFGPGIGEQPVLLPPVLYVPPTPVPAPGPTPIPLVISNDPTTSSVGTPITLTAKGGRGSGVVTFTEIDYNPNCIVVGDQLSRSTFGNCLVRATKASDGTNSAINSQSINFTFYGSTLQTPLSVTESNTSANVGQSIALSTVGGSSTGALSYVITGGTGVGTITGSTLTASSSGTLTVVATRQGDSHYASVVSSAATFTFLR